MAKIKLHYVCSDCGGAHPRWGGQCAHCGAWNTLVEAVQEPAEGSRHAGWTGASSEAVDLSAVSEEDVERYESGIAELDRVLGGGLTRGSVSLLGGDPGIGKSTLLLQVAAHLGRSLKILYASGEESARQVHMRAKRLGLKEAPVRLLPEIELEKIADVIEREKPHVVIIDSIQTLFSSMLQSAPGTVAQVRECAARLTRISKQKGISTILVGHVTKDGQLAGPRTLEHMVDTLLYFEGDPGSPFRMLRALKNRYGSTNELGVFSMGASGLAEVDNPSALFLTAHDIPVAGSCVLGACEGNRPFLVEVQGLVEDAPTPNPKRYATGVDTNRLQMLLAVLNKHAGVTAFEQNVYVKVVGGVRLTEPAADLAVLLAAHSSLQGRPLPPGLVVFGEVGLAGELRAVDNAEARLREAAKLGYTRALIPASCAAPTVLNGLQITKVSRVSGAIDAIRELRTLRSINEKVS